MSDPFSLRDRPRNVVNVPKSRIPSLVGSVSLFQTSLTYSNTFSRTVLSHVFARSPPSTSSTNVFSAPKRRVLPIRFPSKVRCVLSIPSGVPCLKKRTAAYAARAELAVLLMQRRHSLPSTKEAEVTCRRQIPRKFPWTERVFTLTSAQLIFL